MTETPQSWNTPQYQQQQHQQYQPQQPSPASPFTGFGTWDFVLLGSAVLATIGGLWPWISNISLSVEWGFPVWTYSFVSLLLVGILLPIGAGLLRIIEKSAQRASRPEPTVGTWTVNHFVQAFSCIVLVFFLIYLVTSRGDQVAMMLPGFIGGIGMVLASVFANKLQGLSASASRQSTGVHPGEGFYPQPGHHGGQQDTTPRTGHGWAVPSVETPVESQHSGQPEQTQPAYQTEQPAQSAQSAQPEPADDADATAQPEQSGQSDHSEQSAQPAPVLQPEQPVESQQPVSQGPFWFAVNTPRYTETTDHSAGIALDAGVWILALEDRGTEFLVQASDGRTGVLRDLNGIERAPQQ